jgi:2-polyprenyl-6-hydroxyphenyl methylase/3-demethylubiquinone-9 3-methyltransferase
VVPDPIPDPTLVIDALGRLVKPGGHVFVSTLNRTLKAYTIAVLGAEYVLRLLPMGKHTYEKFIGLPSCGVGHQAGSRG